MTETTTKTCVGRLETSPELVSCRSDWGREDVLPGGEVADVQGIKEGLDGPRTAGQRQIIVPFTVLSTAVRTLSGPYHRRRQDHHEHGEEGRLEDRQAGAILCWGGKPERDDLVQHSHDVRPESSLGQLLPGDTIYCIQKVHFV